jgi:serine/threonine protein kinase
VQFIGFSDEVRPLLVMEYVGLGNLGFQDQHQIDPVAVLQQGLKVLVYLHPLGIVHRDIKPANILVKSVQPLLIKFADLGIATDNSVLLTFCGTKKYAAPEIWDHGGYTSAVDIWSLAVVVLECAYGLPEYLRKTGPLSWCRKIVTAVEAMNSNSLLDLLSAKMLKTNPQDRLSTAGCLKEALALDLGMLNIPNFELGDGPPTEKMPTSMILDIVGIDGNTDNDKEVETRVRRREQLQTRADAQASKTRVRQPPSAIYPSDEEDPDGERRKRPRTNEVSAGPAACPITIEEVSLSRSSKVVYHV